MWAATSLTPNLNQDPSTKPAYWTQTTGQAGDWGPARTIEIQAADLYNTVRELLETSRRGIKAVRPGPGGTQVTLEIYNGADLSSTVVFDARFDQFDSATYLLSEQGSMNVAYVYGNLATGNEQILKTTAAEPAGLARRIILVDAVNDNTVTTPEARIARGLIELYKYNATALVDGEISQQIASGFNKDYFLGDILKLVGEYGLTRNVRVEEFIRTSDASGEKAYPAFQAVD